MVKAIMAPPLGSRKSVKKNASQAVESEILKVLENVFISKFARDTA